MAAIFDSVDWPEFKVCSTCGLQKSLTDFATDRAQCRLCYRAVRNEYYWQPGIRAIKNEKRRAYTQRPDIVAKRKAFRARPEIKAKEKQALARYRSRPDIQERLRQQKAEYKARPHARVRALFISARLRANEKNLPFSLTEEWIHARVITSNVCELSGIAFQYSKPIKGWQKNPFAPSIDQIRAGRGYTPENCRMVLSAINNGLGEWGDEVYARVASAFLKKRAANKKRREAYNGQGILTFNSKSG